MPPWPPREPAPTAYDMAALVAPRRLAGLEDEDLIALGADLAPGTLLAAYRAGIFPMNAGEIPQMGWWSPAQRGVLIPGQLRVSRSLRASARRYQVSVDADFAQVVHRCGNSGRPGDWITAEIAAAYQDLHRLGWAHSIEVWRAQELVGGLYGVAIGGLFAGESMFHAARDASKVALVALAEILTEGEGARLIDVQWVTDHLASLGVIGVPRANYLALVPSVAADPGPDWPAWQHRRWHPAP